MAITQGGLKLACPECDEHEIEAIHHGWTESTIGFVEVFGDFIEDEITPRFVGGDDYYWRCRSCSYQGDKEEFVTEVAS